MTTFSVGDYNNTALMIGQGIKTNSGFDFYEYKSMKSIGLMRHSDGNYYVIINFFSNDGLNPLRINLTLVDNQPDWTNDLEGASTAVGDIQSWMSVNPVSATIVSPLGSQAESTSVSVALASDQYALTITPVIIISSGDTSTTITDKILSISFASNGTADALVTFDEGVTIVALPTGTTVNMDAGGINNTYVANCFGYDTDTNAGASLIITYNTIS